ncbi:hypothetical protein C5167_037267, partial [Papaver somniferum]
MDLRPIIVTTKCMKEVKCSWTVEAATECFEGKIETILSRQNQLACNEFNLRVVSQKKLIAQQMRYSAQASATRGIKQ